MVTSKRVVALRQERNSDQCEFDTPTRTRVRDITAFVQAHQHLSTVSQNDIFRWCNVSKQTGYQLISSNEYRTAKQNKNRGGKFIFGDTEWDQLEEFIQQGGFDARACSYAEVIHEVLPYIYELHLKLHIQTIRKAFDDRGYSKCTACLKPFLTRDSLIQRQEYLRQRQYWTLEQWRTIRFSDEVHFGQGPKRKLNIIRKRGERYHPDCI